MNHITYRQINELKRQGFKVKALTKREKRKEPEFFFKVWGVKYVEQCYWLQSAKERLAIVRINPKAEVPADFWYKDYQSKGFLMLVKYPRRKDSDFDIVMVLSTQKPDYQGEDFTNPIYVKDIEVIKELNQ